MFTSPAANCAELGDHDVTVHDGRIHLHYLSLPSHHQVGHAVSEDGLTFVPAAPPIRIGNPGECDDDMIWTMHTVRNPANGVYHMYYTALSLAEHGQIQRVALATSKDFEHWEKYAGNPVCVAAPPHYNGDMQLLGRVAFRDPFVYIEDGVWHMLVCASTSQGDRLRRGCVAHAVSRDGFQWDLRPPLYAPQHMDDLEVPALLKHGDRYYLFLHEFRSPNSPYRVADSLDGPWLAPEYDLLLPGSRPGGTNAVYRFCEWEGQTLLYTWYRCQADWPRRSPAYASLLPPKQVNFEPDGTVRLSSFAGWRRYHRGEPVDLPPTALTADAEGPAEWEVSDESIGADVTGQIVGFAECDFDDFILDTVCVLEAGRSIGLVFRASENTEDGNWIRIDVQRNRVELHHLTAMDSGYRRFVRKQPSIKQTFDTPLRHGEEMQLRLIASREYVELSINDRIVLSDVTYAQKRGRIGVFIENGRGRFGPVRVQPIDAPKSGG